MLRGDAVAEAIQRANDAELAERERIREEWNARREGEEDLRDSEDMVNHPPHYAALDPEPIDAIEGWGLGFHLGQVIKYVARAGRKDATKTIEDLKKSRWYLDRYIERLERDE